VAIDLRKGKRGYATKRTEERKLNGREKSGKSLIDERILWGQTRMSPLNPTEKIKKEKQIVINCLVREWELLFPSLISQISRRLP